jgi:type VI protein secretion system component VasF
MISTTEEAAAPTLTEVCWPVLDCVIGFTRQVKYRDAPPPEQMRDAVFAALRNAEDLSRGDPATERAWDDHVKRMLVYFIDYKMINSDWPGRDFWINNKLEIDPEVLGEIEALGGERFFQECDETLREYELAERRERRDRFELAERLALYFICLRLGFKGQFHDRPQALAEYARKLFLRLPAYAATRAKEMFPDAYFTQKLKIDYKLGMRLTLVLVILTVVVAAMLGTFRLAWIQATGDIAAAATNMERQRPEWPAEEAVPSDGSPKK